MTTFIAFVLFIGFYSWYLSSSRAVFTKSNLILDWLLQQRHFLKWCGLFMLLLSLLFFMNYSGAVRGLFYWLGALMTVGSLTILAAPLRLFSMLSVLFLFGFFIFLELLTI